MSAALDLRNDPRYLRSLLADAREELADADRTIVLLLATLRTMAARSRPSDLRAERRVIGALLLGRARPSDVANLSPADFEGPGHRLLFAVALSCLESALDAAPGWSLRKLLERRSRLLVRMFGRAGDAASAADAVTALEALPWPGSCPTEEIATVGALARWRRETVQ